MGVQGLYSYVMGRRDFFQEVKVHDTKLIIDGTNILYHLAFWPTLDLQHGGDYDALADTIRFFFKALSICKIKPFVVLDGGKDYSGRKLDTVKQRAQQKIKEAHNMSTGTKQEIMPLLIREVFKEVLSSLQVPFVQCMAEADREIASLANEWSCPVLTSDSDFFIFDLKRGCFPFKEFQWKTVTECSKYIRAQRYSADRFCAHFRMNKELLPLFATMRGNDWVQSQVMAGFFTRINFTSPWLSWNHSQIDGLLHWLARFTGWEEALEEILRITGSKENEGNICDLLVSGIREYEVSISNVAPFFEKEVALLSNIPEAIKILPEWVLMDLARGELTALLIDALVLGKVMLGVQVENKSDPSSDDVAQPIREVLYGLLLYEREDLQRQQGASQGTPGQHRSPGDEHRVEEFGREGLTLIPKPVTVVRPKQSLQSLKEAPGEERLSFLLNTFGVERSVLEGVPPCMRLPVCVTCYWMSNCKPKPEPLHLQALLLGMVYGKLIQDETDAAVREEMVRKQRSMRIDWEENGPNRTATQLYNQWQSCMRSCFHLNQLLRCPLPKPLCSQLYSGTLVHGVVRQLSGGQTPESLLEGLPSLENFFSDLQGAVLSSDVKAGQWVLNKNNRKRKWGQGQQQRKRGPVNDVQLNNRFSVLDPTNEDGGAGGSAMA
ncbi:protein asteroid homolog 1-like [Brienomyrus brachyistius]|uniref:protein asteroid homolog 1-like n=1 Tax=Brienomyrus brachyistius TaxID=42636 RepID=UPI0020B3E865|nr:protein asteroid homolog 1-like [Brienomyrus brachyistius]